jgi:hypothetical protein
VSPEQSLGSATANAGGQSTEQNPFLAVLLPVLTVIGTGIGVIGFVIFFGGFIVWTRFDAAGLPANEAVAQVPRGDLVATGASFLVPALLAALGAVALAVAGWDFAIGRRRREKAAEASEDWILATKLVTTLESEISRLKRNEAELKKEIAEHKQQIEAPGTDTATREQAELRRKEAESKLRACHDRLSEVEQTELDAAKTAQSEAASRQEDAKSQSRPEQAWQILLGAIPMLIAASLVIGLGIGGMHFWYAALAIGIALATIALAIVVASMTKHFAWYTLCVFLGIGITIAAATYARTQSNVKISPIAALTGADPIAGFFVAETGDAVYFGVPRQPRASADDDDLDFDHSAATLVRLPKPSVTGLTIGPLMGESDAYRRSLVLALALCHHARIAAAGTVPSSGKASKSAPRACASGRLRQLRRQLAAVMPTR